MRDTEQVRRKGRIIPFTPPPIPPHTLKTHTHTHTEPPAFCLKQSWWLSSMTQSREPTPGTSTWGHTTTQLPSITPSLRSSKQHHGHQKTRNCSRCVTTASLLDDTTSTCPSGSSTTPTDSCTLLMEGSWWPTLSLSWPGYRTSYRSRERWTTLRFWG